MKIFKKLSIALALVLVLSIFSLPALAAGTKTYNTPAEVLAGLTGRTVDSIAEEQRNSRKSLRDIAEDEDVLDDYIKEVVKLEKKYLDEQVEKGYITRDEADKLLEEFGAYLKDPTNNNYGYGTGTGRGGGYCHRYYDSDGNYVNDSSSSSSNSNSSYGYGHHSGSGSGYGMGHGGCRNYR